MLLLCQLHHLLQVRSEQPGRTDGAKQQLLLHLVRKVGQRQPHIPLDHSLPHHDSRHHHQHAGRQHLDGSGESPDLLSDVWRQQVGLGGEGPEGLNVGGDLTDGGAC